jgi:hypothetical protein
MHNVLGAHRLAKQQIVDDQIPATHVFDESEKRECGQDACQDAGVGQAAAIRRRDGGGLETKEEEASARQREADSGDRFHRGQARKDAGQKGNVKPPAEENQDGGPDGEQTDSGEKMAAGSNVERLRHEGQGLSPLLALGTPIAPATSADALRRTGLLRPRERGQRRIVSASQKSAWLPGSLEIVVGNPIPEHELKWEIRHV